MAVTWEHEKLGRKIDARVQKFRERGCDDAAIFVEMADYMPEFKRLMDMAGPRGMDELCGRLPGLLRYAKILEGVAGGIASGEVEVPR